MQRPERLPALAAVCLLAFAGLARGEDPAAGQRAPREFSDAARLLARNYVRPGWRLVDGVWVKPQLRLPLADLVRLDETHGRHRLLAEPSARVEPMLRNWRTSLIELEESAYAWKLSAAGRVWNDTRSGGTQHLQLVAALDEAIADGSFRLSKIQIAPDQQVVQAVIAEDGEPISIIVVLGRDFAEATISRFDAKRPRVLIRSSTARRLLVDHPIDTRRYVVPVLSLLCGGRNPLAPAAGDVYRAFPDLPASDEVRQTILKLAPDLASPVPSIRDRASRELASLGREGVQAALQMDTGALPLEAVDRIEAFVHERTLDARDAEVLRRDSGFLLDCLSDPDPAVRQAAGRLVGTTQPTPR